MASDSTTMPVGKPTKYASMTRRWSTAVELPMIYSTP
jgi:hypothetical protein